VFHWLARLFRRRPPPIPKPDDTYVMGRGQSDPEYATVILRLCGVAEEWTQVGGEWVSSVASLRGALEMLVRTVKERTVQNVLAHERMKGAKERTERFLKSRESP
jgi:hypothetical protein